MTSTDLTHSSEDLERRIRALGTRLGASLAAVTGALEGEGAGPQRLARQLELDKVLTSRLLKALRQRDGAAVLHHVPGPEPLRRFLRGAKKQGVDRGLLAAADDSIDAFERLIREDVGDRSSLAAILAAWLPEAREEFEVRRKQAAYKALSQLKGASVELDLSTVFLHPSADGVHLDVVWLIGMLGLRRLRPGVGIKFSSRRMARSEAERQPRTLDGGVLEGPDRGRLDRFCPGTPGDYVAQRVGDVVHYVLGGDRFGPRSDVDLLFAEVNEGEMPRYVDPKLERLGYAYSDVAVPARRLLFDVFVHEDVYPGREPELFLYDTAIGGIADVNDRARDIDRLDLSEDLLPLGRGTKRVQTALFPGYTDLVGHVHDRMGWERERFRGYRVQVEHPLYGSQIVVAFEPPGPPA